MTTENDQQQTGGELAALAGSETREVFTPLQVECAIEQWLRYGEDTYVEEKAPGEPGHRGYFSRSGWAARCLRYHLGELRRAAESPNAAGEPQPTCDIQFLAAAESAHAGSLQ